MATKTEIVLVERLKQENAELRAQLAEAEETLRAIREGEVDAVVVSGSKGQQVFSLLGADSIYRLIVETMKEAAFTVSFDGTILYCNAQFGQYIQRPMERIVGHALREFVTADNHAASEALLVNAQKETVRQRLVFLATDGTALPAHVAANVLNQPDQMSICVVASDLTELENSTELIQQLRQQQARLARLYESGMLGVIEFDLDGGITKANDKFLEMVGYTREDLQQGRLNWGLMTPPEYAEMDACAIRELESGGVDTPYEKEYIRKDGARIPIIVGAATFDEARREGIAFVLDISAQKRVEAEFKRSNEDLQQFAYVASHDLQEPLRMVTSFLGLLRDRYQANLDDKANQYIGYAVEGATRVSQMIRDLLDFSRAGSRTVKLEPVDFAQVLERVKTVLKTTIDETQAIVTSGPMPTAVADASQMSRVFQNLIANAIKFRAEGRRPEVAVTASDGNGEWVFCVRDNGIGIEPGHAEKVFQVFQRLHSRDKYPGSGIGLAVCRKIVERHGGRIWFESQEDQGTRFYFTIARSR